MTTATKPKKTTTEVHHGCCPIERMKFVQHHSFSLSTGDVTDNARESTWEREPCNTPLFGRWSDRGVCESCATGWTHEHNYMTASGRKQIQSMIDTFVPVVGEGVTWSGYSDRYAGTVVSVSKSGRSMIVREDHAELLNGFKSGEPDALTFEPGGFFGHTSGVQRYEYKPNPEGQEVKFTKRKNGKWVMTNTPARSGPRARIGIRSKHHDYNF